MTLKTCPDCNTPKPLSDYPKDKCKKLGVATYCKPCSSLRSKKYYKSNDAVIMARSKEHYNNNKAGRADKARAWRVKNRDRLLKHRRAYNRERWKGDVGYRLNSSIRAMVKRVLVATDKPKDFITFEKVGYDSKELILRMECQFSQGMSWGNYGEWEIDHKIPVAVMISRGEQRPEKINMLSNLQPLWREENRAKGARYVG